MNKIILICFLGFLISCSRSDDEILRLPDVTEVGANTFGCYINDYLFIPREAVKLRYNQNGVAIGRGITMDGDYYNSGNTFSHRVFTIVNNKEDKNYYSMRFDLPNFPTLIAANYDWGDNVKENEIFVSLFYKNIKTGESQLYTSKDLSGKLIVTKKENTTHVFAATFSGTLKNEDGSKMIEIKDGRFDLNLATINDHYFP